jgi:hypothetical protein
MTRKKKRRIYVRFTYGEGNDGKCSCFSLYKSLKFEPFMSCNACVIQKQRRVLTFKNVLFPRKN